MTRRSDRKQPTTRAERAKARRMAQGRRNTAAWRLRKRADAAQATPAELQPAVKDPVWADAAQQTSGQPAPGASESAAPGTTYDPHLEVDKDGNVTLKGSEPEPPKPPRRDIPYVRRAARAK